MAIGSAAAGGSGLFKFLKPRLRPQSTDIVTAASWGVAAATTALWLIQVNNTTVLDKNDVSFGRGASKLLSSLVSEGLNKRKAIRTPFDWLKKQLFEKPEPEN